jgi:two-component system OmpR family response regulator
MANQAKILVVDDEPGVRELICDALHMSDFQTLQAVDGLTALSAIRKGGFDLMILDINMPKLDGLELLEKIRNDGIEIPALMLSARGDKVDISQGLKLGADDYMTKPFSIEELVLRVKAILKRTLSNAATNKFLQCGPITMDLDRHQVMFNQELVEMSRTEFRLLEELINRAGRVVSKETLLANVWEIDFGTSSTVVETYVSYLRKKLHRDGFTGIKTIRGVGFQIVDNA